MAKLRQLFADYWLLVLIAVQPVLDIIAYFSSGSAATLSGYFRLFIMLVLPLYLLITLKKKKTFIISMLVIGVFCAIHVANCLRLGFVSMSFDLAYMARVVQLPLLAICFIFLIRDDKTRNHAVNGILAAATLYVVFLAASIITGTANSTYGDGIGLSGWVPNDNRTANSLILVTFCCFYLYTAVKSEKMYAQLLIPTMACMLLLLNGTKSCYVTDIALLAAFAGFVTLARFITGEKTRWALVGVLLTLFIASFIVYPYTPRAEIDALQANNSNRLQLEFDADLAATGRDVSTMSPDEINNCPEVLAVYEKYYYTMLKYKNPELFERFELERILDKYNYTTSIARLDKTRVEKIVYASLVFDDSDILTRLFGVEVSNIAPSGSKYDLENDWPAIFFYYGYVGCALYALFVLWFLLRVIKKLIQDFKCSFTPLNFTLFFSFVLLLGLAQFSGALLRRPNVSVYMSVIMALLYYQTRRVYDGKGCSLNET